jgi:hypothetical protein
VSSSIVRFPEKLKVAIVTPVVPIAEDGIEAESSTRAGAPAKSDQIRAISGCEPVILATVTLASVSKKRFFGENASATSLRFGEE